jgi:ABC-type antimicrobial peptide transport system permease subunit
MKELARLYLLMGRKLSGEATPNEIAELERLQQQHPETTYSLQMLTDLWKSQHPAEEAEAEQAFNRHLTRMALRDIQPVETPANAASGLPIKKNSSFGQTRDLIINYFLTIVRSLHRNKGFATINISGLAIGLASAIVLLLWIRNELTYDQYHINRDRVYQAMTRGPIDGQIDVNGHTPMVMAPELETRYAGQVEEAVRVNWVGAFILSTGGNHIQTQGYLCDPGFFKVFTIPLISGSAAAALATPRSIVLSEHLAKKLFGDSSALGKTISVDSINDFVVSAVAKTPPTNTRFQFEYLVPWSYTSEIHWQEPLWQKSSICTYVLLKPGVTEADANKAMRMVIHEHAPEIPAELFFYPMRKWELYSHFEDGRAVGGYINFVRMLGVIAAFILVIACINYMNLSTARSIRHAKEVGVRKVIGSTRGTLMGRFLGESLLLSLVAGTLALGIVIVILPWFDRLVGLQLTIPYSEPWFWLGGIGFILLTGLLAGSYPAFYLSAFRPVNILRGQFKTLHALITPRRILVVFQFSFAIAFIICTIVMYRELDYALNRKSGYDNKGLAFVYIKGDIGKNYADIRNALLASHTVTTVTRTDAPISETWVWNDSYSWPGKDPQDRNLFIQYHTDRAYAATMGLDLLAGRDIDIEKYPADTSGILVTKEAAQRMGMPNPVGQTVIEHGHSWHVVGMINDFVTGSIFNRIYPVIIQGSSLQSANYGTLSFRFNDRESRAANEAKLAAILKKYNPNYPLEYFYIKNYMAQKSQGDAHFGTLAALFSGMAIFISCLGLFGLSAYMAESRLKEVGVRKVLGASIMRITALLSKDFLVLIMIAFTIASPIAWWCMRQWLSGIPYHIEMHWGIFAFTGLLSVVIAIGTVGYQALRAALTNPVRILRSSE